MKRSVFVKKGMVFAVSAMMAVGTCVFPVMAEEDAAEAVTELPQIDMARWQYNSEDDVWYQIGIQYCANPADLTYETLAIFVPGAYMDGTQNEDGTYTCTLNEDNAVEASILEGTEYEEAFAEDLAREDALGNTADIRLDMYTPLYYLMESYDGYETSNPAKYWRIRTGIEQGDTALSTEVNLMLALRSSEDVESVDFETVWGKGHTMAERTGSSTDNFISWVNECMADMAS